MAPTSGVLTSARWEVVDRRLVIRQWPEEIECVAFSPLSGDVHLLNLPARILLEILAVQPQTLQELQAALVTQTGASGDREWEAAVEAALTTLDRAGLIEPRPL